MRTPEVRSGAVWWVAPAGAALLVVPASLLVACTYSDAGYRAMWGTAKALTTPTALLVAAALAAFLLGSLLPMFAAPATAARAGAAAPAQGVRLWPALPRAAVALLRTAARWLLGLTLVGYAALVVAAISRGLRLDDVAAALAGRAAAADTLKELFAPVTGITTLTQLGIAFVVVAVLLLVGSDGRRRHLAAAVALVVALAAVRAFLASERLALIEVVLPAAAVVAMAAVARGTTWVRTAARAAPALLLPAAVLLFGAFEHSRSWSFYQRTSSGSFLDFAVARFAGYYATAYNNHQLLVDHHAGAGHVPFRTLEALWNAPGLGGLYEAVNGGGPAAIGQVLTQYGNPEFNNPCGICDPFVDYGTAGGLVFVGVAGVVVGAAYVAFRTASPVGLLVYPALFTGVLELPRYLYWTQGRLLPALVALVGIGLSVAHLARTSESSAGTGARHGPSPGPALGAQVRPAALPVEP